MNAWSQSDDPNKIYRVATLLRDMIRQYEHGDVSLKPDVYVYTTLIKTCAYHRCETKHDKAKALDIAVNAMATLENTDYGPPNDITYVTMMKAIYQLSESSDQQNSLLETAFRRCAARGLVSWDVHTIFQRGATMRLYRKVTLNTGQLRPEWSRNVPPGKQPDVIHR